jgi:hypothetical protein
MRASIRSIWTPRNMPAATRARPVPVSKVERQPPLRALQRTLEGAVTFTPPADPRDAVFATSAACGLGGRCRCHPENGGEAIGDAPLTSARGRLIRRT